MLLPDNYILQNKDIKHARIRVSEGGTVRLVIPNSFSDEEVESLLKKKEKWILKQQKFFNAMSKINLQRNQLLLFGNRYSYFYESELKKKVIVDHDNKIIRTNKNLLEITEQIKWYTSISRKYLKSRTDQLASNLNFDFNKLFVRNQWKKWGNCSPKKNISLNWRLIKAPQFVIDYLIVHELVHTLIMNHSMKFWIMLKSYYPDYKEAIKWLDKYGNSL